MITETQIEALLPGEAITVQYITVRREAKNTHDGRPRFRISVRRERPLLTGSKGAFSVAQAARAVSFYLLRLA